MADVRTGPDDETLRDRLSSHPASIYYLMLGSTLFLLVLGVVMVWSSSAIDSIRETGGSADLASKQALYAALGLVAMVVASRLPAATVRNLAWPLMALALLLLVLVLIPGIGVEVYGQRGSASFDDAQVVSFGIDGADAIAELPTETASLGGRAEPMAINMAGHEAIFADFVAAVRDGRPPMVTGEDARAAVDALNKIYRMAVPGQKLGT